MRTDERHIDDPRQQRLPVFPGGAAYRETPARKTTIHAVSLLALAVTVLYLAWRAAFTLNPAAWWLSLPLLLLEVHAAVGLARYTFSLWDLDANPPPPVRATHQRVAVLIPTYNEPEEVLTPTIAAAVLLEPAHQTWVLDDGNRPAIAKLAADLGARYLARPERTDAKAGNLNHALTAIDADLIAVFDADHVATPDFLANTLGYFDDPRVAVVQTPQDFYNLASFEHSRTATNDGLHEQSLFYRVIQAGKNRWQAAFWCGTNAVVRVAALQSIGGLAARSPRTSTPPSGCTGPAGTPSTTTRSSPAASPPAAPTPTWRSGAAGAPARCRSCAAPTTPWSPPACGRPSAAPTRSPCWAGSTPGGRWATCCSRWWVLLTGASPIAAPFAVFVPLFVGVFVMQQLTLWLLGRGYFRPWLGILFDLVRMPANLAATLTLFGRRAGRFQVTAKGRTGNQQRRVPVPLLLWAILLASLVAAGWFAATLAGWTPLHYGVPAVAFGAAVWLCFNAAFVGAAILRIRALRYGTERRASVRFAVALPGRLDGHRCVVEDLSLTGARVRALTPLLGEPTTSPATLVIDTLGFQVPLACEVRGRRTVEGGEVVALAFVPGQSAARSVLTVLLFNAGVGLEAASEPVPSSKPVGVTA